MRPVWKESEKVALSQFSEALKIRGIPPIYAPEISDAPDALFNINGRAVAIECRYVSSPALLKFLGKRKRNMPENQVYEVLLPTEPHLWVQYAIKNKNKLVSKYLENTGASEAWLLLHSSNYHPILPKSATNLEESDVFKLLRLGAYSKPHNFNRIWFAELSHPNSPALELFGPELVKPDITYDQYLSKFASYPIARHWVSRVVVNERINGEKYVAANLNNHASEPVCIPPMDSKIKIDYTDHLSDPERSANLKRLSCSIFDDAPRY